MSDLVFSREMLIAEFGPEEVGQLSLVGFAEPYGFEAGAFLEGRRNSREAFAAMYAANFEEEPATVEQSQREGVVKFAHGLVAKVRKWFAGQSPRGAGHYVWSDEACRMVRHDEGEVYMQARAALEAQGITCGTWEGVA